MQINKIALKNFKFHTNLDFDIAQQNCLIYGENGTGKSSIYEALYSVFKTYFRNSEFDFSKYKNYDSQEEELNVSITLDSDQELSIPHQSYEVDIDKKYKSTIYFANQDLLELLVGYEANFYLIIHQYLAKYFEKLNHFCTAFDNINTTINEINYIEKDAERKLNIHTIRLFLNQIMIRANDIINNHFQETFIISFDYNWGLLNTEEMEEYYKYPTPTITLKIDDKENLKLNFNEAKLKLASIAIFFALIKLEEDLGNPLKLLVLDDFLTSLDMANRHYIVEYILNEFSEYQKIILTHNLQFYNLILTLLKSKDKISEWDNKNIFLNIDKEALIYNKEIDYIKMAKNYLNTNSLDEAGIYLRKEFERIVEELRIITEVGAKEKLSNIIKQLLDLSDTEDINIKKMQNILKKTKFYQQTILHSTAHDDIENEKYIKELNGAIVILNLLNKQINILRNNA